MKKEYVKPVMEGEAFVANEYVAACWVVDCDKCRDILVYSSEKPGTTYNIHGSSIEIYTGTINGKEPCTTYSEFKENYPFLYWILSLFGWSDSRADKFHPVTITSGNAIDTSGYPNANGHPNASA